MTGADARVEEDQAWPTFAGAEIVVSCLGGARARYVNLDTAASSPALQSVVDRVNELLPWYSSVHRGAGSKSVVSTAALEGARRAVGDFVDADDDQDVVFVANTTHAANMLSSFFDPGASIVCSPVEHHANLLPWRRHSVEVLPYPSSPGDLLEAAREVLERRKGRVSLLSVTAASNVTGEIWPIGQLAELAHAAGAEIFVDAAQLAPRRAISLRDTGVDYVAFSGHKLYAPFGAGALIGRKSRLRAAEPWMVGGGAAKRVELDDVVWQTGPERHEAGSPNTIGIVALGAACDALAQLGMEQVAAHEVTLTTKLRDGIDAMAEAHTLQLWACPDTERVGVATFVAGGYPDRLLAEILAAEHGIGVRTGRFCAHTYVSWLLDRWSDAHDAHEAPRGGAVRASVGLNTTMDDIDRFLTALGGILTEGPAFEYRYDEASDAYEPSADDRVWPELGVRLAM